MVRQTQDEDPDRVDAAFNRVLAAEAEAREAVERCRGEAASILAAAEDQVRSVASRTDHRMGLAHRIADAQVALALAELVARAPTESVAGLDAETLSRLGQAIETLVDEVLAPPPGDIP